MVALLPGRMTRSQTGSGSPARTKTSLTPGSIRSGSKSSKLAMRERTGTATVTPRCAGVVAAPRPKASSAGRCAASAKKGARPKARQPVRSAMSVMPLAKRLASPRNLLTRKPAIVAASSGASAAFVPEHLREYAAAVDVADEDHGAAGRPRKPHVGDVAFAQVDLGRAARALDQNKVGLGLHALEAVEHGGHEFRLERLVLAGLRIADDAALHHDLRADLALRLQQHRVHVHGRRNATCARLKRLRAADLAAVRRDRRIVRHVLRLERPHDEAAP